MVVDLPVNRISNTTHPCYEISTAILLAIYCSICCENISQPYKSCWELSLLAEYAHLENEKEWFDRTDA